MIYYKSRTGEVFAYESEQECQEWGAPDLVAMTAGDVGEHLNPTPTTEQLAEQAFAQRTALLKEIDAIATHPLRWAEISEDDKASIGQYRLDVIDINNQSGFPHSINWPAKPSVIK